jgi:AraC-like DNA-binding protein
MRIAVLVVFIFMFFKSSGQDDSDSALKNNTFESLIDLYDQNVKDTVFAKRIARLYIEKARNINDSTKMARGYQRLAFISKPHTALKYLDTTILLSINSKHKNFPASGYLFKSFYLYNHDEYEKSLQNAILGYQFAKKKNNLEQQLTALHQINGVNELWGDYENALETEFITYNLLFSNQNIANFSEYYLSSLEGIGKCYVRLNKPDSALVYFRKGIDASLKAGDSITYAAFVSQSGTALYVKGQYEAALDSLQKADSYREDFNNSYLPNYYYYAGSAYYNLGEKEKAVSYFQKIDSIYEKTHVLFPELPRVYDKLVSYYKAEGNDELQLAYLYKLVLSLRIIDDKRIYIKEKTRNGFEIPKLVEEKELLIANLEAKNMRSTKTIWIAFGFLGITLIALFYYFKRQQIYKRRFENLMTENNNSDTEDEEIDTVENEEASTGISPQIINEILTQLQGFENEKHYLSQDVSLSELAKSFGTNSTYLSKIINIRKRKNFSNYINDLRIEYAVQELKKNPTFRKYTIKAIANESGFKSAESFSKTFYKKHGIYPSYYLKQLQSTH